MGLTPTNTSVEAATVDRKGFTFNLPSIPNDFDSASPKARSRLFCCVASSSGVTTCTPKINGSVIDMGSGGFLLILGKIGLRAALISSANRNDSPSPGVYRTLGPAPANRAHALAIAACCSAVSSRGCICALSSAVRCSASAARCLACSALLFRKPIVFPFSICRFPSMPRAICSNINSPATPIVTKKPPNKASLTFRSIYFNGDGERLLNEARIACIKISKSSQQSKIKPATTMKVATKTNQPITSRESLSDFTVANEIVRLTTESIARFHRKEAVCLLAIAVAVLFPLVRVLWTIIVGMAGLLGVRRS